LTHTLTHAHTIIMFWFILVSLLPLAAWGLTHVQMTRINRLMMNPDLPCRSKHMIESVLYKNYEQWAIKIGSNFKKKHSYKCRHIPFHEMSIYSRTGLLNAIRRYHPTKETAHFHAFAVHHIRGQLYKGMTDLSPITNVSRKRLRNRGTVYVRATTYNAEMANKNPSTLKANDPAELWQHIEDTADPFTRRCIVYKFDYDFNKIRSHLEVSRLMECSEETVRQAILDYFVKQHLGIVLVRASPDQ